MPDPRYKRCKGCGRSSAEVGELSWTRMCVNCGPARQWEHNAQMHAHEGPIFQEWRRRMAAAVGAVLLDDYREKP